MISSTFSNFPPPSASPLITDQLDLSSKKVQLTSSTLSQMIWKTKPFHKGGNRTGNYKILSSRLGNGKAWSFLPCPWFFEKTFQVILRSSLLRALSQTQSLFISWKVLFIGKFFPKMYVFLSVLVPEKGAIVWEWISVVCSYKDRKCCATSRWSWRFTWVSQLRFLARLAITSTRSC